MCGKNWFLSKHLGRRGARKRKRKGGGGGGGGSLQMSRNYSANHYSYSAHRVWQVDLVLKEDCFSLLFLFVCFFNRPKVECLCVCVPVIWKIKCKNWFKKNKQTKNTKTITDDEPVTSKWGVQVDSIVCWRIASHISASLNAQSDLFSGHGIGS